jgi:hypothetical protein
VYRNGGRAAERLTWECEKDGVDAGKLKHKFLEDFSLSQGDVTGRVQYTVLGYVTILVDHGYFPEFPTQAYLLFVFILRNCCCIVYEEGTKTERFILLRLLSP